MEIEILIDNGGNSKVTVKRQEGEDPACYVFQKIVDSLKANGVKADNIKQDARTHGHTHTFR
jgi:hypothetical protein